MHFEPTSLGSRQGRKRSNIFRHIRFGPVCDKLDAIWLVSVLDIRINPFYTNIQIDSSVDGITIRMMTGQTVLEINLAVYVCCIKWCHHDVHIF